MINEFLAYGQAAVRTADLALATPASNTGPLSASVNNRLFGQSRCLTESEMTMSGGTVAHYGRLGAVGIVEAKSGVIARRKADGETVTNLMALSYQSKSVKQANWLQFLGPSVVAITDAGEERLVGKLTFGKSTSLRTTVTTTQSPADTPYFLDHDRGGPFANRPKTTFCQTFASGKEKFTFFDSPISDYEAVLKSLSPFKDEFSKQNSKVLESLILVAEFYSYLILNKTAVYVIRWQAEHELIFGDSQDYRQSVYDADSGPVMGLPEVHSMIMQKEFPNTIIR